MQKVWRWFVHFGVFWGVSHQGETQLDGVGMKAGLIQSILQQKRYVHCILTCLNKYRLPLCAVRTISCSKATSALHLNTRKRAARTIKVKYMLYIILWHLCLQIYIYLQVSEPNTIDSAPRERPQIYMHTKCCNCCKGMSSQDAGPLYHKYQYYRILKFWHRGIWYLKSQLVVYFLMLLESKWYK
jgi:hypothetical protein